MVAYYIGIVLLMRVVQSFCSKKNAKLLPADPAGYLQYTTYYFAIAAALAGTGLALSAPVRPLYLAETLCYALPGGIAMSVACLCTIYNLRNGTMALNALFSTAGLLIPTTVSAVLYGESVPPLKLLAILIFFAGAYLLVGGAEKLYGRYPFKNFLMLVLLLLGEGTTMTSQKLFGMNVPDGSVFLFTALSFGSGTVMVLLARTVIKLASGTKKKVGLQKRSYLYGIALAVAVFLISQLATLCAPHLPAVVLFTLINGGAALISATVGAIFFRERITLPVLIGLALGIGALILIAM